jgi:hypothetical protein
MYCSKEHSPSFGSKTGARSRHDGEGADERAGAAGWLRLVLIAVVVRVVVKGIAHVDDTTVLVPWWCFDLPAMHARCAGGTG